MDLTEEANERHSTDVKDGTGSNPPSVSAPVSLSLSFLCICFSSPLSLCISYTFCFIFFSVLVVSSSSSLSLSHSHTLWELSSACIQKVLQVPRPESQDSNECMWLSMLHSFAGRHPLHIGFLTAWAFIQLDKEMNIYGPWSSTHTRQLQCEGEKERERGLFGPLLLNFTSKKRERERGNRIEKSVLWARDERRRGGKKKKRREESTWRSAGAERGKKKNESEATAGAAATAAVVPWKDQD